MPEANASERNLATVRRFIKAIGEGKLDEAGGLLHDDFVVYEAGGLPYSGEYYGAQGFVDLLTTMNELMEVSPGPRLVHALPDNTVASRFRLQFTVRTSGKRVEMNLVELYRIREGQISELDVYYKDPSAVAALLEF